MVTPKNYDKYNRTGGGIVPGMWVGKEEGRGGGGGGEEEGEGRGGGYMVQIACYH